MPGTKPLMLAHRGASGERPEHTVAAYEQAIKQGADYIELDLIPTKDGVLIVRHENELGDTTDVAARPQFAARKTTKTIDGRERTGYFAEDFTLAEIKILRCRERLPDLRPQNASFDGQFEVLTFAEVLELVRKTNQNRTTPVGVYPELKHPAFFRSLNLPTEERLCDALTRAGYGGKAGPPVFIQCFEVDTLRRLRRLLQVPLVFLVSAQGSPADTNTTGDKRTYADYLTARGLADVKQFADGIGPEKSLVIGRNAVGALTRPTVLVADAHRAGLVVHPYTFRSESHFLPVPLRGKNSADKGDFTAEYHAFFQAGVDGVFSDWPADAVEARAAFKFL